ncbi:OmpA family protein [Serratia silvae]|uniref:OmpA family protein n=1 Tax=Serratia silvae TaxID=2824122 RepID=A0ABT0KEX8_9GAMM|nr:OmpA family protein [Serratia silvae]MCL1030581.1 OmpA family protein [Serratia silvae]
MYQMGNVINQQTAAFSPQVLTVLEQKLATAQEKIALCLNGMGALILQKTRDYLHRNDNSLRFRQQVGHTPHFELRFLDEALGKFSPALLTMVLGHKLKHLTQLFVSFYVLEKQVAERLFSVASAVVFGLLGQYLRQRSLQSPSLKGWLEWQLPRIAAAQPTAVLNQLPALIPADPAVSRTGSLPPPKGRIWPWLTLVLLLLVSLLFSLRGFSVLQPMQASGQSDVTYRRLADGKQLLLSQRSVENLLITYIESNAPTSEKRWFTLDRLRFDISRTELTPASQEQLRNIVDILRAYPNVEIQLGGYTDKSANEQMDLRLSQDRADTVRMALVKMGIGASRISAEGYGSAYPLVPNDSEANRAKNRRIDLRVIEK